MGKILSGAFWAFVIIMAIAITINEMDVEPKNKLESNEVSTTVAEVDESLEDEPLQIQVNTDPKEIEKILSDKNRASAITELKNCDEDVAYSIIKKSIKEKDSDVLYYVDWFEDVASVYYKASLFCEAFPNNSNTQLLKKYCEGIEQLRPVVNEIKELDEKYGGDFADLYYNCGESETKEFYISSGMDYVPKDLKSKVGEKNIYSAWSINYYTSYSEFVPSTKTPGNQQYILALDTPVSSSGYYTVDCHYVTDTMVNGFTTPVYSQGNARTPEMESDYNRYSKQLDVMGDLSEDFGIVFEQIVA